MALLGEESLNVAVDGSGELLAGEFACFEAAHKGKRFSVQGEAFHGTGPDDALVHLVAAEFFCFGDLGHGRCL